MNRRQFLIGTGGIGTAAIGGAVFVNTAAASSHVDISAADVAVSSDHGEIDRVSIQPNLEVNWDGFDEVVGKVRILIEASPHDVDSDFVDAYAPVWRATGWLNGTDEPGLEVETGPGYHGDLHVANEWFGGPDGITLFDRTGAPDYATLAGNRGGGVSEESLLDGTSVGSSPPAENGTYGQAGHVDHFFNPADGTNAVTTVDLRYTVSLHMGDESSVEGYDVPPEFIQEHSPLVMADADDVDSPIESHPPESVPYAALRDNADGHPAILVHETSFDVSVENEPSEFTDGTGGDTNGDVEASDDIGTVSPTPAP